VTFLVILTQMATIGALWAYLDPLGRAAGLSATQVGALISAVLLLQVAGGSTAAVVVRRLNARIVLLGASLLIGSLAWGLHGPPSATTFCVLSAAFGFVWMFLMPFQVRLAFDADAAGRVAVLVPGLQLLGTALGPLCASLFLVSEDDAHSVPWVCAGFALAALCLLIAGRGCFGTRELIQNQKGSES
jgi:predicted MFS family arabinose efflux permease